MKLNNSNKLVLSAISILASACLLYWTLVYWIFNNLTLHEGQSRLNTASIISTIILVFITIVTIASIIFFIKFFLKTINRKKEKAEI
jgi:cytochrome bd-type quinol oxidase subunit 2